MPSSRTDIGAVTDFSEGKTHTVNVFGRALVVVRKGQDVFVLRDTCPHQGAPLADGLVSGMALPCVPGAESTYGRMGEILVCPWHGWEFDLRTGCTLNGTRQGRVKAYEVSVEEGRVLIEI